MKPDRSYLKPTIILVIALCAAAFLILKSTHLTVSGNASVQDDPYNDPIEGAPAN